MFAIGIAGLFSARITESIKFAINRADLRTKQYESLCTELSTYIFRVELLQEFITREWTREKTLSGLVSDYNKSMESLRANEYVYLAWMYRFWSSENAVEFSKLMQAVKEIDGQVHELNEEFGAVNNEKSKEKMDPAITKPITDRIAPLLDVVRTNSRALLESLR